MVGLDSRATEVKHKEPGPASLWHKWKYTETHKWCSRCEQMLEHNAFAPKSETRTGLDAYCRGCKRRINIEQYAKVKAKKEQKKEQGRRVCSRNACETVLSRYNPNEVCSVHERIDDE